MSDRSPLKVRKTVDIWGEDFQWFDETHYGASLSWFVGMALHAYREVCTNPREHNLEDTSVFSQMIAASKIVKEEIDK